MTAAQRLKCTLLYFVSPVRRRDTGCGMRTHENEIDLPTANGIASRTRKNEAIDTSEKQKKKNVANEDVFKCGHISAYYSCL